MRRSSFLLFALMFIFNFCSIGAVFSAGTLLNGQVSLQNDADGNGYINRGDTIRIRCNAIILVGSTDWQVPPTVDLSALGMSSVVMNDQGGDTYQADVVLDNWNQGINYAPTTISIYAISDTDLILYTVTANPTIDLAQVVGVGASALPATVAVGGNLTIQLTDNAYQATPLGGTIATVNLTPIGGNATTPLTHLGGGLFRVVTAPITAGQDYVGPLTITLNDPMLGHPALPYQTGNITVDTGISAVDYSNTTVVINSGNAVAIPGDVLRITAGVTAYDSETVRVSCASLGAGAATPPLDGNPVLNLISSSGPGNPATWQLDVTLTAANLKNTSLPFIFTFTDDVGNVTTVTRYISIDLLEPNMISSAVNVYFPDGNQSSVGLPGSIVATNTCTLQITSNIDLGAFPDTLTATVDLSAIGGSAAQPMTRIGLSNDYRASYTVTQGILEDGFQHIFVVTAKDAANNTVAQATTPNVRIDNNPPTLTGAQLTATTANLIVGSTFTIECNATNLENGSVSVNLSNVGLAANAPLPNVGGNTHRGSFILPDSRAPGSPGIVDGFTTFTISADDTVLSTIQGHVVTATTNQIMVDNEPPTILASHSQYIHNLYPTDDDGYSRIGDTLSFHVRVASAPISVKINLASLGQSNAENMIASAAPSDGQIGWYDYVLLGGVATGTINRAIDMPFTVTLLDDADNATSTPIFVNIDNKPVEATGFVVEITYKTGLIDNDPSVINLNKSLLLRVPITLPIPDDHAPTAIIDLTSIGGAIDAPMAYSNGSYSVSIDTSATTYDSSGHRFQALIADLSGNRTVAQSNVYRVDCNPPTITSAVVEQLTGGAVAIVGDTLRFRAQVSNNEGIDPQIDLSNIGGSTTQALSSIGGGWYEYTATIGSGTVDEVNTAWQITAQDNDLNYVEANTNLIALDNFGPDVNGNLTLLINGAPVTTLSVIKIGDSLNFTIDINNAAGTEGPATIDLRPVGGVASAPMTFDGPTTAYNLIYVATAATAEYTNHRFNSYIDDKNANRVMEQSSTIPIIDCQPVTFSNSGIIISNDNGDNPVAGIANIGDVLMVYASASAYVDSVASATIGSGTVDFVSTTMVYNAARNRHEALFTVETPGLNWGLLTGSTDALYYKLAALDDVSNLTQNAPVVSTFTIRNVAPEIDLANTHLTLSPNRFQDFAGGVPVYNIGTDTVGDRLIASITFANGLPMHRAWLDFSELGSGTVELLVTGNSAETSAAGIPATKFSDLNFVNKRVYLKAQDQAGNISIASKSFWIDNTIPQLTSATFDGTTLTVNLSETFANLEETELRIVGSNPAPLNTPAYVNFLGTAPTIVEDLTSFDLTLALDHQKEMAQWASTPVYLEVTNTATSAVTDLSGNELRPVSYFPITITDSSWREPARITQFTVSHNWPASITLDLFFSKSMDPGTLVASNGVFLTSDLTYDFPIDYTTGYVLQPEDVTPANLKWTSNDTHLQIILSENGRDWVARKMGNGANTLRFASRISSPPSETIFVYDALGKPMQSVPTSASFVAADNRPTPNWSFKGPPEAPYLDLASRTLVLSASGNDRLLLSNSPFETLDTVSPDMGMPVPANSTRVSAFFNKVVLHDIDNGTNSVLELQPIDIATNGDFASKAVTLKLTDNDFDKVIAMFKNNPAPIWRMAVGAGAFTNLWGTPNTAYLPSGNPGPMAHTNPSGYTVATFAACATSDKPPISQKLAGELIFEIEVFPPELADGKIVPLQSQLVPTARIVKQSDSSLISSGTFVSYSERTVSGKMRSIFRFSNTSNFASNLQKEPAKIEITGIKDIFGISYSIVASQAYDLNTRNDSLAEGYSDTASAPIEIDTKKPLIASIIPYDVIGRIPSGSNFKVNFDETMDPAMIPTLQLATGTTIQTFTFAGWTATATADFTNDSDFTASLPNGIWLYQVSGGRDSAGNTLDATAANAFPVQVRTYAPEVTPGNITLRTIQNTISLDILESQPWASDIGDGFFSIKYTTPPSQFLPHFLEIFDPGTNTRLGRATVIPDMATGLATATFTDGDFLLAVDPGATGPTSYAVRVIDSSMNETEPISTIIYDNLKPDVASFDLTGIGSSTATTWYYRQTSGSFNANVVTTSTTDTLKLAIFSEASNATTTINLTAGVIPGNYSVATGSGLVNGTYTLTIVDLAGNIGSGPASKRLIADNVSPTVASILPNDAIGNSPAGLTQFTISFSEAMDGSPTLYPAVEIATSGFTIPATFSSWIDPLTAIYENTNEITPAFPTGTYTYRISGGRDMAGNALIPTVDGTHEVMVYSQGPFARIDVQTDQSHIYGAANGTKTNFAFNPAYSTGIAQLTIDYAGGPFNTMHDLAIYKTDGTHVGSYTGLPGTDPVTINFSIPPAASYTWTEAPIGTTNETYQFKLVDSALNISGAFLPNSLRYDTTTPDVASISIGGPGIATDTGAGLAWYYSPAQGNASFTVMTNNSDAMRLLIFKTTATTATFSTDLSSSNGTTHKADFGSALVGGNTYVLSAVDTAGNIADGLASRSVLIADSSPPSVSSATPIITGALMAGTGRFEIIFDERMNTSVAPTLQISSGTTTIAMTYVGWVGTDTVRFTNSATLDSALPVGSYSYIISGAKDLAGNPNNVPAVGAFEVELFTAAPSFTATLHSQQNLLFGNTDLLNRPYSINAAPGIAELGISYLDGPFQDPHTMMVYNNDNTQVATITITPDMVNKTATATVNAAFFGTPLPANVGPATYSFRLLDSIGNLSATSSTIITYDALEPILYTAQIASVSDASLSPLYYNNAIHGDLKVKFTTNASDPLVLVLANGVATPSFDMVGNPVNGDNSYALVSAAAAGLAEGIYAVTAADWAGNFATGAASVTALIIDRTAPSVISVVPAGGLPISSRPVGGATFTVTFNDNMNQLASATPILSIATASQAIACTFESWLSSTQARFVTSQAITPDMPQGDYFAAVTAWDITGNKLATSNAATLQIRSRGPVVSSFVTRSFQSTTATDTNEILLDTPFSFNVAPGGATMSIQLAQAPDSVPLYLHFMTSNATVASYAVALSAGNAATFTWTMTNGPTPVAPTTYNMKLVDGSGDFSLESYNWTMDASAPAVMEPVVTGGAVATSSVYFNPLKHGYISTQISAVETEAPRLRISGINSTDTYNMGPNGPNSWIGAFDGRFSRGSTPKQLMPDGVYKLDLVDRAGNVALLASGSPVMYNVIIDTVSPGVATYSTLVGGVPVTAYSPSTGNLEIRVVSPETLNEQGIYWMNVLNSSNVKIRQLPISNVGGNYTASWDGKNTSGAAVIDGNYTFRATDYAGNQATGSVGIFALTTEFKVTGISQLSSSSAKIWFNHEIDAASLVGAAITVPGLTTSSIAKIEAQAISFKVAPTFTDLTPYTFTITPGTIKSIFGAGIASPNNAATLTADGVGPKLSSVTFTGLSGQQEFKVVFDENYKASSAADSSKYSLTGPSGIVAISQATTQADTKTVLLTAATNLIENADYQIAVTAIEDVYGNISPASNTLSFKGRDLTPPVLEVSAFSNPANENDIIVVVVANELLNAAPTLHIAQSNAPVITTQMQPGSDPKSYMIGVHLSTSYPGNGTLAAYAEDMAGNQGSGNSTFTVAYISANKLASIKSADNIFTADFKEDSLKNDAVVKIMAHKLEKAQNSLGEIRTALQRQARIAMGIRASQLDSVAQNHSELVPVTDAYEISVSASKISKGFNVFMDIPEATATKGLGMFFQSGDQWKFVSSTLTRGNKLAAKTSSSQVFAIMRDIKAPEVSLDSEIDLEKPFETAKPEFRGQLAEAGSGLDLNKVSAHVDSGPAQPVTVDSEGKFIFKPMANLTGGRHDLVIRSSDKTGNLSQMAPVRFAVVVPLSITQIAQYPNPARRKAFIRISANRSDVREDLVRVRIYDVAGHKITTLNGIKAVNETWGVNARFLYDIPWDLKTSSGKDVANGVYFARIEIRDPDNPAKKVKETFKIAVLR